MRFDRLDGIVGGTTPRFVLPVGTESVILLQILILVFDPWAGMLCVA